MAGVGRLELRNVVAKYPFERSHRFQVIQPNSGRRDYSRSSCDGERRSSGLVARISGGCWRWGSPPAPALAQKNFTASSPPAGSNEGVRPANNPIARRNVRRYPCAAEEPREAASDCSPGGQCLDLSSRNGET